MEPEQTNRGGQGEAEFVVEKLVYGGDGLGRDGGRVVLVPFTLPGERVRVRLVEEKTDLARGRLVSVLSPAAERIAAECPHFARCGGCHYQHAPYEFELKQKEAILRETLRRVGRVEAPASIGIISGPEWGYRNRVQVHLEGRRIGFMAAGSHSLCAVERCPAASPRLNEALRALHEMAGERRFPPYLKTIELFTNETDVQVNVEQPERRSGGALLERLLERIPGATAEPIEYAAAGERFRVDRRTFFQVNRFLADRLAETALENAAGDLAMDLYAGAGLFTLPLARRFARVRAVESGGAAARDLEFNARRAGLNVEVKRGAAEEHLGGERPELVVADPPRAGLGRRTVEGLVALAPQTLVVVSCEAATLARDLAGLVLGGYRLARLTLVDLFPRTCHLEAVARLERN